MTLLAALRSLPRSTLVLRSLIPVFSVTALLVALPEWPNTWLLGFLVLCSLRWALRPEDVAGVIVLVLVVAWWGIHGADGPRLFAVAGCLLGAHVVAILSGFGPARLAIGRRVVMLWLRRAAIAVVPVPVAYVAVHALEAEAAPPWLWTASVGTVAVLTLVATAVTRAGDPQRRGAGG